MSTTLLLLGLAVLLGTVVQSTLGFGLAVVAAPAIIVAEPELMPTSLLLLGFALPTMQLLTQPRDIAWRLLGWALGWRLLLTAPGVWLVAVLPAAGIAAVVGVLVLVSVVLSLVRLEATATPRNAALAGAITGVSGTAAAIGGPFFALVLQHEAPDRIRSTLAAFFVVGSTGSLAGLALGGQVTADQLRAGLVWLPFLVVGLLLSGPVRRHVDQRRMRAGVLALCVLASVVVLVRAALS